MKFKIAIINFTILCVSIVLVFLVLEFYLIIDGRYKNLTKTELVISDSGYERPPNSFQYNNHPDLNFITKIYYDEDGVRNDASKRTSNKKNIIAFFGDSMTENFAIEDKFTFENILNESFKENFNIVNYGIGGYSIDNIFLRYLKYKSHDIKHLFYVFMPGDYPLIGNKRLIYFDENNNYFIQKKKINYLTFYIGKLNITYLFLDVFYKTRAAFNKKYSLINKDFYPSVLANKTYKVINDLHHDSTSCNSECLENLYLINLKIFKNEVEKNNSTFNIIILPSKFIHDDYERLFKNSFNDFNFVNLYTNDFDSYTQFKNDGHPNELGNLIIANKIFPYLEKITKKNGSTINQKRILIEINKLYINYSSKKN